MSSDPDDDYELELDFEEGAEVPDFDDFEGGEEYYLGDGPGEIGPAEYDPLDDTWT